MRKGVSPLISAVMYVALSVAAVGIVLNFGTPVLDRMQDTGAITNSIEFLHDVDAQVQEVAEEGRYSARTLRLTFQRGSYHFDNTTGELYYEIDTESNFISSQSSQERGNLLVSANADVSVTETTVNGTDCYMMENQHLKACVRKIPETFDSSDHPSLDGFWRFNEGSGQWANDSSSASNNGKLGGSTGSESSDPSWASGIDQEGLEFDGNDDDVVIGHDSSLNAQNITVTAWMKTKTWSGDWRTVIHKGSDGSGLSAEDFEYNMRKNKKGMLSFNINTTSGGWVGSGGYNISSYTDTWIHAAGVTNGSHVSLYVDGTKVSQNPYSGDITTTTQNLKIGDTGDNGDVWNGFLDSIRFYDRSLTAEEIEWNYLQQGDVNHINTSELLVSLHNKDLDVDLDPKLTVLANGKENTITGTGDATAERTGGNLGRGRVTAQVDSDYGLSYDINIDLISGADFLKVDAVER